MHMMKRAARTESRVGWLWTTIASLVLAMGATAGPVFGQAGAGNRERMTLDEALARAEEGDPGNTGWARNLLRQTGGRRPVQELDALANKLFDLALHGDMETGGAGDAARSALMVAASKETPPGGIPYDRAFDLLRQVYEKRAQDAVDEVDPVDETLKSWAGDAMRAVYLADPSGRGGAYLLQLLERHEPPERGTGHSTWCYAAYMLNMGHDWYARPRKSELPEQYKEDYAAHCNGRRAKHAGRRLVPAIILDKAPMTLEESDVEEGDAGHIWGRWSFLRQTEGHRPVQELDALADSLFDLALHGDMEPGGAGDAARRALLAATNKKVHGGIPYDRGFDLLRRVYEKREQGAVDQQSKSWAARAMRAVYLADSDLGGAYLLQLLENHEPPERGTGHSTWCYAADLLHRGHEKAVAWYVTGSVITLNMRKSELPEQYEEDFAAHCAAGRAKH